MATLAVAGVSARLLAERAARDGYPVVALDVFGDVDTRRAASQWRCIGSPARPLAIDAERLLAALDEVAAGGDAIGWIAGSGFEGQPELLERGAARLPLIGCTPDVQRRIRAPRAFFARLDALGIAHPEVRFEAPPAPAGWLRKDAGGHGGWHVRRVRTAEPPLGSHDYFQREAPGRPMSAGFIAASGEMRMLGCHELLVRRFGERPFVYAGCVGPLVLAPRAAQALQDALDALVREFALQGLASLDFLLDGDAVSLLEVNPRPSASLALHGEGWLRAHARACLEGVLPPPSGGPEDTAVGGHAIVYARRPLTLTDTLAAQLAATPYGHDLPHAGTHFANGDPVCSVDARAPDAGRLKALLAARRAAIEALLETSA